MKVCDVVLNSVWYDPRVRKQIMEYKKNDIDVCCVGLKCNRYDAEKIEKIPCKTIIVTATGDYMVKLNSLRKKLLRQYTINNEIANAIIATKPDIIHANDLNALIPAYKASKKLKCKLIYDSHEINTDNYTGRKRKIAVSLYMRLMEQHICKKIDKMVCVSNAAAEYFEKEYNIQKPMVVTNCVLKAEQVNKKDDDTAFEVLNHGQFTRGRGYDLMLEAANRLSDYSDIRLAIRGMGVLENELRERATELEVNNFHFYPPVLVENLIREASKSKVGVAITEPICLNFKLSVSNKLFEYAAAGLPVIMSDIPEHRYLNDKYHFGVVLSENSPQAFAKAVIKLYTDKDFYNECATNARLLSEKINWENEFKKLIDFERELMKQV